MPARRLRGRSGRVWLRPVERAWSGFPLLWITQCARRHRASDMAVLHLTLAHLRSPAGGAGDRDGPLCSTHMRHQQADAAAGPEAYSLWLDGGRFDDWPPFLGIGFDKRAE